MNIGKTIWKLFSIQRDEIRFVAPLFILYFLSGSFYTVGQIFTETLFLKTYGVKALSNFFIKNGIALISVGMLYNYFLLKFPLRKGYFFLISLFIILIASSFLFIPKNYYWLPFYYYMGNYLFTFFLDLHFFNFAFQYLTIRSSKRILPILMGGGKLGGIISSLLFFYIFSENISKYGTYVWIINGSLIFIPLFLLKIYTLSDNNKAQNKGHELIPNFNFFDKITRKIKNSFSAPSFTYSILIMFILSIVNQLSEYYFMDIFNKIFLTKNELASFLSIYSFSADFLTFIIQFFIISRIIQSLGVQKSNFIYPASFLTTISLYIAFPNLVVGILFRFFRKNLSVIIRTPIYNIIMAASPRDRMTEVKSFISGIINPLGMIVGGGILLLIYKELSTSQGYTLSIFFGILYLVFAYCQSTAYTKSLRDRISFKSSGEEGGIEFNDYKNLLSNPKQINENLETIEVFFNENPTLIALKFLYPNYYHISSNTKENILNLLTTGKSELKTEIINLALYDRDPFFRGKALSLLTEYPYIKRKNILNRLYPNVLKSEGYAISILLSRDGKIDKNIYIDDFIIKKIIEIKMGVLNGEVNPIEFVILIQVLPYQYFLNHLYDLAIKTKNNLLLKQIIPFSTRLTHHQIVKLLYTFRFAPIDNVINLSILAPQIGELDKAILLDYREISEDSMNLLFIYNEKSTKIIVERLFKNKSYNKKSNYLNYIMGLNIKPEKKLNQFINFEVNKIIEIHDLIISLKFISKKIFQGKTLIDKFLKIALNDYIDLHKHLIFKAIAIITGIKIDEVIESNLLLKDNDLNNYILEYIESSMKHTKQVLPVIEGHYDPQHKRVIAQDELSDLFNKTLKYLNHFMPETTSLLNFCFLQLFNKTGNSISNNIRHIKIDHDSSQGYSMLSFIEKIIFLRDNTFFNGLKIHELIHIVKIAREINLPPDKIIIKQGEAGNELYILISGEVEVYTNDKKLASLGPGSCIGELSIIDEEPRSATVKTKKKTKILSINRRDFLLTLKENPSISINIMQVIAGRLRKLLS